MRTLLVAALVAMVATPAQAAVRPFNHKPAVSQAAADLGSGNPSRIAGRVEIALAALVGTGVRELEAQGHRDIAARYEHEWLNQWSGHVRMLALAEGLGDHRPLSQWLADFHDRLEDLLGPMLMSILHLDDIKVFNHGLPVVFGMRDFLGEDIDLVEYELHWTPFCGVVAYWSVWATCTVATWGAGAITMICSPAGMLGERLMVRYIAPPLADDGWRIFWQP